MPNLFATQYRSGYSVKDTPELGRVLRLPRRLEVEGVELTELLRTVNGAMTLRPEQAQALWDIGTTGGLFAPMRVGAGKTLISLLAPVVAFSTRPLLLVPAKLVNKTHRDRALLKQHWDLPEHLRIMSYEWLGRVQAVGALDAYKPDLIIADECHKLRNTAAAVTRRVARWFRDAPKTMFVGMSGTITKRSLHDFSHLLKWVYDPDDYPLPVTQLEREVWADAIDERKSQMYAHPGALKVFCNEEEQRLWRSGDERRAARKGFRRHFVATPGVVATEETPIDATLVIESFEPKVSNAVEEAFGTLRRLWETPDGWPMVDGLEMFRHARELALGFFYRWEPRPPQDWIAVRKSWCSFARAKIRYSNTWDSELQVRQSFPDAPELRDWLAVKDIFTPNTVPVWIDDYLIDVVAKWAKKNPGIVWTEHRCVGERLEKETGLIYYGRKGQSKDGLPIESHPAGTPLIASVQSNGEGRNLQAWCHNLVLSPPPNGQQWEQLIGRSHRDGQEADEVYVDVLVNCREHVEAFAQAVKDAKYVEDVTGSPQKLLYADIDVTSVSDMGKKVGLRWA